MFREHTKTVTIGNKKIGGGNPGLIQSMTNTHTEDVEATVRQILELEAAGCEIIRCTVPTIEAAKAVSEIKKYIHIPLVADIHFDYRMAIAAMENGADKIRINPGNIGGADKIKAVVDVAKERNIPIRVGVNSGSLEKELVEKYHGVTAEGIVESAIDKVHMIEEQGYDNLVVSIKSSDVMMCVKAHELIAQKIAYPLHVGITESGTAFSGSIKSALGLGLILNQGIGDTIRVSLTDNPVKEVEAAKIILKTLGLRKGEIPVPEDMVDLMEEYRAKLLDYLADYDEDFMMQVLEGEEPSIEEIKRVLRIAVCNGDFFPVLCGSAYKNKGVQLVLDAVVDYLPSPLDVPSIKGTTLDGEPDVRHPGDDQPFSALAFKIATDPFVGKLSFFRVYSGKIEAGSYIYNSRSGKKERVSRLFQMHSNKQNPVEVISAGDIGAGVGFKDIRTGDTLCDETAPIVLESMDFPEPVIGIAVEPKTQKDLDKLSNGLAKLAEEDPTFTVKTDEQTGQTVISGMGELHLDIIIDRLKREFKVECNQGRPQVSYKEAITKTVELREVYKKQSGGRGKFADIIVSVGPVDEDFKQGGLQFIDEVKGGNVPKEFIPSVQKGFLTAMKNGVLAGYPLDSLKVVLKDGSFHPVDSDQLSFEICAIQAYKNACVKAGPVLMEPIMKLEVVTPEENMGDVIGDLNRRRGQVEGMETSRSGARIVKAMVPLAEMFGYVTALRTITSGRATSSMTYDHHAQVSSSIAKTVLEEVKGRVDLV